MKTRRPSRPRARARMMWAAQRYRLTEIAEGRMKPRFEREHLFLWTLRSRGAANPSDFILPDLLFMAEIRIDPSPKVARWADDEASVEADGAGEGGAAVAS